VSHLKKVAWIGLGNMGLPMARNLAKHGYPVTAYNRTAKDAGGGLVVSSSLRETVADAAVVVVMVSDGAAFRSIMFGAGGALQWLQPGTLVVNMSTIGVDDTKDAAVQFANVGVELMDAPVSGSVGPAENGTLVVLAGGSEGAFRTMEPLFQVLAKSAHYLGEVGSGSAMKLLVNAYLGLVVEGVSECMAAADKAGIGRSRFLDVLSETSLWSPILAGKQGMWVDDQYPAAFALKHMVKDMALMSQFAIQMSAATPTLMSALNVYLSAQANDLAEDDMSAVLQQVGKTVGNG
jgi:3-hydroxyisobutyrate dehydrogenase